jgi:hypothetical protein
MSPPKLLLKPHPHCGGTKRWAFPTFMDGLVTYERAGRSSLTSFFALCLSALRKCSVPFGGAILKTERLGTLQTLNLPVPCSYISSGQN